MNCGNILLILITTLMQAQNNYSALVSSTRPERTAAQFVTYRQQPAGNQDPVLLLLESCPPIHCVAAGAEGILPITDSGSAVQEIEREDINSAGEANPRSNQTEQEWKSYLENVGKIRIDLALDGFKLRNIFVQGNTAFSIIYQFYLGEDCHPTDIDLILGKKQLDNDDAAKACLAKWTLSGFPPYSRYLLVLNWEHIKGYTTLTIIGDQMNLSIRLKTLI
ncbi:MAG TPA: hypothetical protein P5119_06430 [Candidatus Aminicenantes bacterium]|nr:hypothetical protein [Candidatus Aminicenantes bacterium]HRY64963.1 hypothetical protein [Candidatus Aminicenantes bacterium]HRZ71876.1 hypothetical protein [Candidatus Aminicenantes bacterium]